MPETKTETPENSNLSNLQTPTLPPHVEVFYSSTISSIPGNLFEPSTSPRTSTSSIQDATPSSPQILERDFSTVEKAKAIAVLTISAAAIGTAGYYFGTSAGVFLGGVFGMALSIAADASALVAALAKDIVEKAKAIPTEISERTQSIIRSLSKTPSMKGVAQAIESVAESKWAAYAIGGVALIAGAFAVTHFGLPMAGFFTVTGTSIASQLAGAWSAAIMPMVMGGVYGVGGAMLTGFVVKTMLKDYRLLGEGVGEKLEAKEEQWLNEKSAVGTLFRTYRRINVIGALQRFLDDYAEKSGTPQDINIAHQNPTTGKTLSTLALAPQLLTERVANPKVQLLGISDRLTEGVVQAARGHSYVYGAVALIAHKLVMACSADAGLSAVAKSAARSPEVISGIAQQYGVFSLEMLEAAKMLLVEAAHFSVSVGWRVGACVLGTGIFFGVLHVLGQRYGSESQKEPGKRTLWARGVSERFNQGLDKALLPLHAPLNRMGILSEAPPQGAQVNLFSAHFTNAAKFFAMWSLTTYATQAGASCVANEVLGIVNAVRLLQGVDPSALSVIVNPELLLAPSVMASTLVIGSLAILNRRAVWRGSRYEEGEA